MRSKTAALGSEKVEGEGKADIHTNGQATYYQINEQKKAQSQRRAALQEFVPFEAADLRERKELKF